MLADIELIEFMDRFDARRADSWKRTFEKLYSISFADRRLVTGDSVEIYNIYGTIRSVRRNLGLQTPMLSTQMPSDGAKNSCKVG